MSDQQSAVRQELRAISDQHSASAGEGLVPSREAGMNPATTAGNPKS